MIARAGIGHSIDEILYLRFVRIPEEEEAMRGFAVPIRPSGFLIIAFNVFRHIPV